MCSDAPAHCSFPAGANKLSVYLQEADMPLIPHEQCSSHEVHGARITPDMLCAGYLDGRADACQVSSLQSSGSSRSTILIPLLLISLLYCHCFICLIQCHWRGNRFAMAAPGCGPPFLQNLQWKGAWKAASGVPVTNC